MLFFCRKLIFFQLTFKCILNGRSADIANCSAGDFFYGWGNRINFRFYRCLYYWFFNLCRFIFGQLQPRKNRFENVSNFRWVNYFFFKVSCAILISESSISSRLFMLCLYCMSHSLLICNASSKKLLSVDWA